MADGGISLDKSPSPPRLDFSDPKYALTSNIGAVTLSEHISRFLSTKHDAILPQQQLCERLRSSHEMQSYVRDELQKRDEIWREHERLQIEFLQQQHQNMLSMLHEEIRRLQAKCREKHAMLFETPNATSTTTDINDSSKSAACAAAFDTAGQLTQKTQQEAQEAACLREAIQRKEQKILILEGRLIALENRYKSDVILRNEKIKELTKELYAKNSCVAQLTTQLHQLRLKEAFERQKQQHRLLQPRRLQEFYLRKASENASAALNGSSPNLASSNSPEKKLNSMTTRLLAARSSSADPQSSNGVHNDEGTAEMSSQLPAMPFQRELSRPKLSDFKIAPSSATEVRLGESSRFPPIAARESRLGFNSNSNFKRADEDALVSGPSNIEKPNSRPTSRSRPHSNRGASNSRSVK